MLQSGQAGRFLNVTTSGGSGVPAYPGFAGAPMDGTLTVGASSEWAATIYNQTTNKFSFTAPPASYSNSHSSSDLTEMLNIYTYLENAGLGAATRYSFVLISLDDDPDNFNSAIVLTQRPMGSIAVSPSITRVDWAGESHYIRQRFFRYRIQVQRDYYGGSRRPDGMGNCARRRYYFEVVDWNYDPDPVNPGNNYVTVKARGEATDSNQSATLTVRLMKTIHTKVDISLVQTGYTMGPSPNTFSAIPSKGGETAAITVTTNGSTLTWSAAIDKTSASNGTLADHAAIITDASRRKAYNSSDNERKGVIDTDFQRVFTFLL